MTQQDDGTGREHHRADEPLALPRLKSAVARAVRHKKPRRFVTAGQERSDTEVIEIDVETDAEFYVGGTGPALFVGDIVVVDSERIGENKYRFFAPAITDLKEGAPIALGRAGSGVPAPEQRTRLRLQWHGEH
jgi:hypothetical protein